MGIVFFSGGILCFVLYGYASISLYRLRRSGVRTKGRTVAWRDDEDNAITLEVTFLDQKGIEHKVRSQGANSNWFRHADAELDVLYPIGRPRAGRIEVDMQFQRHAFTILGLLFAGIGLIARLWMGRWW